jgi:hypothetical protein
VSSPPDIEHDSAFFQFLHVGTDVRIANIKAQPQRSVPLTIPNTAETMMYAERTCVRNADNKAKPLSNSRRQQSQEESNG